MIRLWLINTNANPSTEAKGLNEIANQLRLHPIIKRMLGEDVLEKMGATPLGAMKAKKSATKKPVPQKPKPRGNAKPPKVKTTIKPATKAKPKAKAAPKKRTIN